MMVRTELDEAYLVTVSRYLKQLSLEQGVLISAHLGDGNKGVDYVLRRENPPQGDWLSRLFEPQPLAYSYRLADRDESGARALSELKDRGLNLIANALAQSSRPRRELLHDAAGLIWRSTSAASTCTGSLQFAAVRRCACRNLRRREERKQSAAGLCDVCLALTAGTGRSSETGWLADGTDVVHYYRCQPGRQSPRFCAASASRN